MARATSLELSPLIRKLREAAGLTQAELAERLGTTQSVISRLESDDYEGHSLSMLNRIGAALNCRLTVGLAPERSEMATVRESAPTYGAGAASNAGASDRSLSDDELDRIAERLAQRFHRQGVTKADVKEALHWARCAAEGSALGRLRGAIKVGAGSTVDDVRRARAQRGHDIARVQ
jgi:transcriptional regulator with XRE-family HTH domain